MMKWSMLLGVVLTIIFGCASALAEKRVALVIGNSEYRTVPRLANPRNDAADMRVKLGGLGFEIFGGSDLDRQAMLGALTGFGRAAENADVALIFYAGHGLQVKGENYLVPVDANVEYEAELNIALVPFSIVMQQLQRGSRINIALLDACRDNPFQSNLTRSLGTRAVGALGRGLSRVPSAQGTFIAYATEPDNVAQDGDGRNSPFTSALLAYMDKPLSISDMMIEVRNQVIKSTNGKQLPWDTSSLTGRFSFRIEGSVAITPEPSQAEVRQPVVDTTVDLGALELAVWNAIQTGSEVAAFEKFLNDFPNGVFAAAARGRISVLKQQQAALSVSPSKSPEAEHSAPEQFSGLRRLVLKGYNGPTFINGEVVKVEASVWVEHNSAMKAGEELRFQEIAQSKTELHLFDGNRRLHWVFNLRTGTNRWRLDGETQWKPLYNIVGRE